MSTRLLFFLTIAIGIPAEAGAQGLDTAAVAKAVAALKLRSIGPASMSGRISDIAVHPRDPSLWYVAAGSGGVWKTVNAGTTWTPIFDDQSSYSIGEITLDPTAVVDADTAQPHLKTASTPLEAPSPAGNARAVRSRTGDSHEIRNP